MLSLVYTGGEILASKRVRYDDLIAAGFDERVLADRLLRQHKLMCAAIRAGRLSDLVKMTERDAPSRSSSRAAKPVAEPTPVVPPAAVTEPSAPTPAVSELSVPPPAETPIAPPSPKKPERRLPPPSQRSVPPVTAANKSINSQGFRGTETATTGLIHLVLLEEKNYRGGDIAVLRVRVENASDHRQTIPGADVIVKILGSTFRPLIYQTKTGVDGVALVQTELPHFRSGRAAILIRVTVGGFEAELRRIIQQG